MPHFSRRTFIKTAAATTAFVSVNILSHPGDAAEFTYKFGNNQTTDYPITVRATEAAARIREKTSGRFELQIFPAGQLGSDTDMLSQVRSGALQFYTCSGINLSMLVPVAAICDVGFAFKNYDQVWGAMDGDLGNYIRGEITKKGLYVLPKVWDIGFRQTTSSLRPIRTPDDFKGLKIRLPNGELALWMFKAFGAAPVTMNWAEVYTALQTHIADAQENPLSSINAGKLYEVQKYCSMTNHMWDGWFFLGNGRAWQKLPKDIQEIVENELNVAAEDDRKDIARLDSSLAGGLKERGLIFNDVDIEPFHDKLRQAGFYPEWKKRFGDEAWSLLEKYVGKIS